MKYFLATAGFAIFFGIMHILLDGPFHGDGVLSGDAFARGVGSGLFVALLGWVVGWVLGRIFKKSRFKCFLVGCALISVLQIYIMISA